MVNHSGPSSTVKATTFLVWAAAAASLAYWGLKLSGSPSVGDGAPPAVRQVAPVDPAAVARLLGFSPAAAPAGPAAPSLASRFKLLGVVAATSGSGTALIAIDGKPPKPFRVGSVLEEGLVLKSVEPRGAVLAPTMEADPVLTLELPPLAG